MIRVEVRSFTDADLGAVEPWFDDAETRRRLGGRGWPAQVLRLVADPPAGTGRFALLACEDGGPVGLLDVEIDEQDVVAFAIVVAPPRRRRGVGRAMIGALIKEPRVREKRIVVGAETDNFASIRLVESCGFVRDGDPDAQGFVLFRYLGDGT